MNRPSRRILRNLTLSFSLLVGLCAMPLAAAAQLTTTTVVHGLPGDGLGLASDLPVDIHLSGLGCAITDLRFGDDVGPLEIPADVYDVEIRLRDEEAGDCGGAVALAVPGLPLEEGENSTIVAHLDADGAPTASKLLNDLTPGEEDESLLSIRHLAEAPAVDIRAYRLFPWNGPEPALELIGVVNGDFADAPAPFGVYIFTIAPTGDHPIFYDIAWVMPGLAIQIHAVGSVADGNFRTIVTSQEQAEPEPVEPEGTSVVSILHGITVDGNESFPVDVWIEGLGCALPDFQFGDVFGPAEVPAGMVDVEIRLPDAEAGECGGPIALAVEDLPLLDGENSTVIAHLDADGGPTASKFVNDVSPAKRFEGRFAVHHTAAAPAVDIGLLKRFFFFSYRFFSFDGVENGNAGARDLRAGSYGLDIAPAGGDPIFSDHFRVHRDELVSIYAVGGLADGTFQLLETRQPLSD